MSKATLAFWESIITSFNATSGSPAWKDIACWLAVCCIWLIRPSEACNSPAKLP